MAGLVEDMRRGDPRCGVLIASGSACVVEIVGDLGFSMAIIGANHSAVSPYSKELERLLCAARAAAIPALVAVPESTPGTINRALNDGADGVIVPRVESAAEAQAIVNAARYPPVGRRGAAPVVRAAKYGLRDWEEYLEEANEEVLVLAAVETPEALNAAPAMLEVEGLDGIVIDALSVAAAGEAAAPVPDALPGVAEATAAARAREKICGAIVHDFEHAELWARAGCALIVLDSDLTACAKAMADARTSLIAAAGAR